MLFSANSGRAFSARICLPAIFVLHAALTPAVVTAADPVLSFDFSRTLACRDATPEELGEHYPDVRVVECTLRLSVYLESGDIGEVEAIRVEIGDDDARLRVHDFAPRTRLESEFAGEIEWTKTTESSHSLGGSLGGELPCLGGVKANVTPSINGGIGGKEIVTESQKRIAPKQVAVASGTLNEEHGVFFILRPTPTSTLEGVHELSVQFVVPADWRGDAVRVNVQATGQQKTLWITQQKTWAKKSTGVVLFSEGDAAARRAALRLVRQ
jgi:hypothetical protein